MTDHDYLLRAILDEPGEDAHRFVLADWLEDHDQPKRAEFIRWQMKAHGNLADMEVERVAGPPRAERCSRWGRGYDPDADLRLVMDELHAMPAFTGRVVYRKGFVYSILVSTDNFLRHARSLFSSHPIEEVRLSDKEPSPHASPIHYSWRTDQHSPFPADQHYVIPDNIYRLLDAPCGSAGYWKFSSGRDKALAALSTACVAWGREVAELSPLERP